MGKLFVGYLFIFLNLNITIDNHVIALLPGFVGYYFMVKGLNEMSSQSEKFETVRPFAVGMGVYTGIFFVTDLLGVTSALGLMAWILSLIAMAISLYISYVIIQGIEEIEEKRNVNLEGKSLKQIWVFMAVMQVVTQVMVWVPSLAFFCAMLTIILTIVYLVCFHKTKTLYEAL